MTKGKLSLLILLFCTLGFVNAQSPKREMRAVWVATAARIDWPPSVLTSSGNATQINNQKSAMTSILDEMQAANMNAIYFQVRSRCDAMYESSYEPWSSDLVYSRGAFAPGYDPLQFVVSEAHKRGIEVHAWVNPYRFESISRQWSGQPGDYRASNPSWVMTYSDGYAMLDPGHPDVQTRIKNIVTQIVSKYDIDGVVFDDYFYSYNGTSSTLDQTTQNNYNKSGMNLADWRRKNVNDLISGIYDAIQSTKSYVTFGVAPFGVWTINTNVANSYGLTLPTGVTGLDAYNTIYCDAVAWLKQGKVDYVSPQLYWNIGGATDYNKLCEWWSNTTNTFGRHFFASQNAHDFTSTEISNQIKSNRSYTKNAAPGSVLYSKKDLPAWFLNTLKANHFTHKSLTPAITWKTHPAYGVPGTPSLSGTNLTWTAASGVPGGARYTVYAVPSTLSDPNSQCSTSQYLLGISYTNSFTVPSTHTSGYKFVIGLLDRMGNEFIGNVPIGPTLKLGFSSIPSNDPYIVVSPEVKIGKSVYLTIHDGNQYISRATCTLSSSNPSVATIDANGTITGFNEGQVTITAVRNSDGAKGTATITVVSGTIIAPPSDLTLSLSSVSTSNVPISNTGVVKNNGGTGVYLWIVDPVTKASVGRQDCDLTSSVLSVASISIYGTITTYSTDGQTLIKAVRKSDGKTGYLVVTVGVADPPPTKLTLGFSSVLNTPYSPVTSTEVGQNVYLTIHDGSKYITNRTECTLTSSNPAVASIAADGTITPNTIGSTTITAVRKSDNLQGTISLSVTPPYVPDLQLGFSSVMNAPYSFVSSVERGKTVYLTIHDGTSYITNRTECTLSSSNPAVASIAADGTITPSSTGSTTITAVRKSNNATGTVLLTVIAPVIEGLSLSLSSQSTTNIPISNENVVKNNGGNGVFLWIEDGVGNVNRQDCDLTSSNTAVATISIYGTIFTYGIDGKTTIKAVRKSDKKEGSIEVSVGNGGTVVPCAPSFALWLGFSSVLSPPYNKVTSVEIGKEVYLTIEDDNGTNVGRSDCTLTSNNSGIASITAEGTVKGVANGTAAISAVRKCDNVKGAVNITVIGGPNLITPAEEKAFKVYNTETGVLLEFEGMAHIELYSVNGILIDKAQATQSYSRDLAKGAYILHIGGKTIKIIK